MPRVTGSLVILRVLQIKVGEAIQLAFSRLAVKCHKFLRVVQYRRVDSIGKRDLTNRSIRRMVNLY